MGSSRTLQPLFLITECLCTTTFFGFFSTARRHVLETRELEAAERAASCSCRRNQRTRTTNEQLELIKSDTDLHVSDSQTRNRGENSPTSATEGGKKRTSSEAEIGEVRG